MGYWISALASGVAAAGLAWMRTRTRIARLETKIRALRELADRPSQLRRLTPEEEPLRASLDGAAEVTEQLRAAGFEVLGELVDGAGQGAVARWLVDDARTTFLWLGVVRGRRGRVVVMMGSHRADGATFTRWGLGPLAQVATPPMVQFQVLPTAIPIADAVARHRAFAGIADREHVKIESLDDVMRERARMRELSIAWRATIPPTELIDLDLRSILGKHYDALGRHLARRLEPRIPQARTI